MFDLLENMKLTLGLWVQCSWWDLDCNRVIFSSLGKAERRSGGGYSIGFKGSNG